MHAGQGDEGEDGEQPYCTWMLPHFVDITPKQDDMLSNF